MSAPSARSVSIRFDAVNKHYDTLHVLKDITGAVKSGEVLVVCGPSGSGKSTLIRTVTRLAEVESGEIYVGETEIRKFPDVNKLRTKVSFLAQAFHLFPHLNARDNIALGPRKVKRKGRDEAYAFADRLLASVGLSHRSENFPVQLSGGEQQRVAICRALAMEPEALLFDEPTSALDPEMIGDVLAIIKDLARQGRTMICVTHEIGFAREVADTIWFMDRGEVVETGTPSEFLSRPKTERAKSFLNTLPQSA